MTILKRILRGIALAIAILVLLIEDAAWALFGPIAEALARQRLIARLELWIRHQAPWVIAFLFLTPTAIAWPIKFYGLALIGLGHPRLGLLIAIAAEVFGTLLLARLWIIGRPKLLTIGWFAVVYGWIDGFRQSVYGWVRRQPVWIAIQAALARIRAEMRGLLRP